MARHPSASPVWDQPAGPLVPPRGRGRWLWLALMGTGFLAVLTYVLRHDPGPGLSGRGWLTLALAGLVVVLLTAYRTGGARLLARAAAEYAVVALLAVLLATTGHATAHQPAHQPHTAKAGAAAQLCPALVRELAGGLCDRIEHAWRQAKHQQSTTTTTTTRKGHAMPLSPPTRPLGSKWG